VISNQVFSFILKFEFQHQYISDNERVRKVDRGVARILGLGGRLFFAEVEPKFVGAKICQSEKTCASAAGSFN